MAVWTHGRWTVKPGREEEFVAALGAMGAELGAEMELPAPVLLRDRERPNLFLTFGRWESIEAIESFRELAMPKIGEMQEMLEGLEIFTLDELETE